MFCIRFNNYKSDTRKVLQIYPNKCNVYEKQFHCHCNSERHIGMEEWKITIIDRAENVLEGVERVICNTTLIHLSLMD